MFFFFCGVQLQSPIANVSYNRKSIIRANIGLQLLYARTEKARVLSLYTDAPKGANGLAAIMIGRQY